MATRIQTLLLPLAIAVLMGCGGGASYAVRGTDRAPGVDATVEVSPLAGGNNDVMVRVAHMPPPDRLSAGATTYSVWARPAGRRAIRLGNLPLDDREASIRGTTTAQNFELLITAERREAPAEPSEHIVLRQRVTL